MSWGIWRKARISVFPKIKLKIPGIPLGSHTSLSNLKIHLSRKMNQAPKTLEVEKVHESFLLERRGQVEEGREEKQ